MPYLQPSPILPGVSGCARLAGVIAAIGSKSHFLSIPPKAGF